MIALKHLRRPRLYTLTIVVIVFLLDSNLLFKVKVVSLGTGSDNETEFATAEMQMSMEHSQIFSDLSLASSLIFQHIPLFLILVCNISLVVTIAMHSRKMETLLEGREKAKRYATQQEGKTQKTDSEHRDTKAACYVMKIISFPPPRHLKQGQRSIVDDGFHDNYKEKKSNCPTPNTVPKHHTLNHERQTSVTVLGYSFIFILLAIPNAVYPLLKKLIHELSPFQREHYLALALSEVFLLLNSLSAAMNLFVYFLTGSAFRAGVLRLFGHK